jgi:4-alpha-glucanotransferase
VRDEAFPRGRFLPAEEPLQQALGERNFKLLSQDAGIVAEDLGVIPRFVRDTLARLGLAGYQVMRWSREDGIYRDPRHYPEVSLVTTGTHDTDTMRGWWETAPEWEREAVCHTWPELGKFNPPPSTFSHEVHEALLRAALNAQSQWCILPWQDIFGEEERVNTPGTVGDHNWAYRMRLEVEQLGVNEESKRVADWLARLTREGRR